MFADDGPMLDFLEEAATVKLQTPLHVAAKKGHADVVKVRTEIFFASTYAHTILFDRM